MITLAPIGARSKFSSLEVKIMICQPKHFISSFVSAGQCARFVPILFLRKRFNLFETARWAPSGTNIQPWRIYVASGEACDRLRAEFLKRFDAGERPIRITLVTVRSRVCGGIESVLARKCCMTPCRSSGGSTRTRCCRPSEFEFLMRLTWPSSQWMRCLVCKVLPTSGCSRKP